MKLQDKKAPARGVFTLRVKDRAGNLVHSYSDNNMIVNGAREALALLVSTADASDTKCITKFGVGTSTTEAAITDTELEDAYIKSIDSYDTSVLGQVTFHWSLAFSEANDMDIAEFGLLCEDETLFAHKVRGSIAKDSDLSFEGDWTIVF